MSKTREEFEELLDFAMGHVAGDNPCVYANSHAAVLAAYDAAITRAEQAEAEVTRLREAGRPIPVSERLPEQDGEYLAWPGVERCDFTTKEMSGFYHHIPANSFYGVDDEGNVYRATVTHWMPLPAMEVNDGD